jgi:hypothetical protein
MAMSKRIPQGASLVGLVVVVSVALFGIPTNMPDPANYFEHEHSPAKAANGFDESFLGPDSYGQTDRVLTICDHSYANDYAVGRAWADGRIWTKSDLNGAAAGCYSRLIGGNGKRHDACVGNNGGLFGCGYDSNH